MAQATGNSSGAFHRYFSKDEFINVGYNPQDNNSTGFTAILCGFFDYSQNIVLGVGVRAGWWTTAYDGEYDEGISVYIENDGDYFSGD